MAIAVPVAKSTDNIYEIMKSLGIYKKNKYTGDIALEIETETSRSYDSPALKFWDCKRDGSLREHGIEYVMKGPVPFTQIDDPLKEFQGVDKAIKFNKGSISTSVHAHINFLTETFLTMANFLTAYALVENLLVRYSGPDRLSNLFCMPFRDAEGGVSHIEHMLQNIGRGLFTKMALNADAVKYGAINCAPLTVFGTLEIRTFRGETDITLIKKWVQIIQALKTFAKTPGLTPIKILDLYKKERGNIIKSIFGGLYTEIDCKDREELILYNLKYAARFAVCAKNWNNFGVMKMKPVYKEQLKTILDKFSQDKFSKNYDELQYAEQLVVNENYERANTTSRVVEYDEDL